MPALRTDRFWTRLVWPLLWPLLLAQLAVVLLCLAVALFLWLGQPEPASWTAVGWLLLALLLGTTFTTAAFLLQLRHRLRACQSELDHGLEQLERRTHELGTLLPPWLHEADLSAGDESALIARLGNLNEALLALQSGWQQQPSLPRLLSATPRPGVLLFHGRIVAINRSMEQLFGEPLDALLGQDPLPRLHSLGNGETGPELMQILDAKGHWHHRQVERFATPGYELMLFAEPRDRFRELDELLTARERAREESRLKSRYLALLNRELGPLLDDLDRELDSALGRVEAQRRGELRERAADVRLLLDSLVDEQHQPGLDTRAVTSRQGVHVLIVDDGPVNRMLATQVLEGQGVAVDCVASGREALERRRREHYDLVFMDIYMPDMDGVETVRHWREAEANEVSATRSVLIALTANASESDQRRFRDAGMDDYLAKPYRPNALIAMLRHWRPDAFKESTTT
ncbi:response regulator [Billgrantia gudaonensis]|uniref:CheY chemotaxis protein or a CheY-like REC (Receiver) domain n=1 Tax=Billgrantia gudaonensis TaxID=376427 RepID=A0A1G9BPS8_9GAMM|nr:response regulator [Halomonas gudaonensis]SDK40875.1 CheY chemotaxis protein or a CheY-like REC (receiver) domain [Halomonas gudaonensis]